MPVEVQVLSSAPSFFALCGDWRLIGLHIGALGPSFVRVGLTGYFTTPIIAPLVVAGWSSLVARRAHNP